MSAKKSADNSSEPSQIVVGDGKKKRSGLRARLPLVAGIVLLLAVVGVAGLLYQKSAENKSKKDEAAKTQSSKVPADAAKMTEINGKKVTTVQRSQQAIYYGDYNKGQQILEDEVASAKTADEKVSLYLQLGANALNAKKYDEANTYAQQALKVKKTAGAYSLLAAIAVAQGNKAKAIEYANEQKKLLDPKASAYEMQVEDIDKFIKEQQ